MTTLLVSGLNIWPLPDYLVIDPLIFRITKTWSKRYIIIPTRSPVELLMWSGKGVLVDERVVNPIMLDFKLFSFLLFCNFTQSTLHTNAVTRYNTYNRWPSSSLLCFQVSSPVFIYTVSNPLQTYVFLVNILLLVGPYLFDVLIKAIS